MPKEEEQHRGHEEGAFEQVPKNGARRSRNNIGLTVERPQADAWRQHALDLDQAPRDALDHLTSVCALEEQHHRRHCLAKAVTCDGTKAWRRTDGHARDVPHIDRCRASCADDHVADIGGIGDPPKRTQRQPLAAILHIAGAKVCIVALEREHKIAEREVIARKFGRIAEHMKLLFQPAPRIDVGHTGHCAQHGPDDVLLRVRQLDERRTVAGATG